MKTLVLIGLLFGLNHSLAGSLLADSRITKDSKPPQQHAKKENPSQQATKPPYCWKPLYDAVVKHTNSIGGKNLTWAGGDIFIPNEENKNLYEIYYTADVAGAYMSITLELRVKKAQKKCKVLSVKELDRHNHS